MSLQQVQIINGRLITEPEFRQRFFDDPHEATKDYELTTGERATLRDMSNCMMTRIGVRTVSMRYRHFSNKLEHSEA